MPSSFNNKQSFTEKMKDEKTRRSYILTAVALCLALAIIVICAVMANRSNEPEPTPVIQDTEDTKNTDTESESESESDTARGGRLDTRALHINTIDISDRGR